MNSQGNYKITERHLQQKAFVYIRQSSGRQVAKNKESQRMQRALVERAHALGWKQVELLEHDLGASASIGAADRIGFDKLVAAVALGEVGVVFSLEASRLSRTDKDWCQLLEVCQIFGTLIADAEHVYDVSLFDDQMILGIKGTMSVLEVQTIKARLVQGMFEKARRGELVRQLPPGFVRDASGSVVKDPDERVQHSIGLVFEKFQEIWSVRGTFQWFHESAVELPVNKSIGGRMKIVWQVPRHQFVRDVLRNPFYAGAYVFGRRATTMVFEDGRLAKRQSPVQTPKECRVFLPDHHEGYIDWMTFEENQRRISVNNMKSKGSDSTAQAARSGKALLTGLLRCGKCGRKLHVAYWGARDTDARYLCHGSYPAGGRHCLGFGAKRVDRRVEEELLQALSPLAVEASLEAMNHLQGANVERHRAVELQLEQLEYEAQRAFEQYDEADPRNRLAARQLEQRWNDKLEKVGNARAALSALTSGDRTLSEEEKVRIQRLGKRFPEVWRDSSCPPELKKKILRTVLEEIMANVDASGAKLEFVLHWRGGAHTKCDMDKPLPGPKQRTAPEDLEIISKMADRHSDEEIARVLGRLGRVTVRGKRWSQVNVTATRQRYGIRVGRPVISDPDIVTLGAAARHCAVSETTIKKLVASGVLGMTQVVPWAPWEIKKSELESDSIKSILERLRRTGKLVLGGVSSANQGTLFPTEQGLDNDAHCE